MRKKASELGLGERGRVAHLAPELAPLLSGRGIRKDSVIEVSAIQPMNGPVVLRVNGSETSLGRRACQGIIVEMDE